MLKSTIAAVLAVGLAGVALADTVVTAKLAAPRGERERVIAGGQVWLCSGDTCTANLTVKASPRTCQDLAREVGLVVAFGNLNEGQLARCNARVTAAAATTH